MNKTLLFTIIFVLFGMVVLQAQDVRYGVRAGLNYSQIGGFSFDKVYIEAPDTPDEVPNETAETPDGFEDNRIGFVIGFFADYYFNEKFSIQPEIQFSNQGNKYEELRVNALQLPIVFKYHISDYINVHLGPEVGFKIWEWEKNENFGTFLFSGTVGVGVNITDNFYVNLRYAIGLNDLFEDEAEIIVSRDTQVERIIDGQPTTITITDRNTRIRNLEGKSSYFQLSFGYRL
ncbi:porin family protein [Aquimarina sp. MMG016]|uniref:porin family protein n=1 Tax=Aquimarina sp. MMG016 TaxID=2822690 RepID=UPI001B3A4DB8|nr:porin family protein [Aquimarina sp. MMG016]MBQ4819230.1 PorT family protein [Aquimarina sp. MMG016]